MSTPGKERIREQDMLTLHRRHLTACGVPRWRVTLTDAIPTTRNDLREHYGKILDGAIARPEWAKGINL